jgi:hypothetical protein
MKEASSSSCQSSSAILNSSAEEGIELEEILMLMGEVNKI